LGLLTADRQGRRPSPPGGSAKQRVRRTIGETSHRSARLRRAHRLARRLASPPGATTVPPSITHPRFRC